MRKAKKTLLAVACAGALVVGSVAATVAYLTDDESVLNTFTVGNVAITLDEANLSTTDADDRTEDGNAYHLLPGQTYTKDPVVTVLEGSDSSYVRVMMTVSNASAVQAIIDADDADDNAVVDYADLFGGWDEDKWLYEGFLTDAAADTITFEFRYFEPVAAPAKPDTEGADHIELKPVFTQLIVPGYVTNEQLAELYGEKGEFKIALDAHAIQKAGFDSADAAWAAWN